MKKNVIFVTLTFTAFFLNIFSIDLILFQIEALKGLPIKRAPFKGGGDIQNIWEEGRTLYGES